MIDRAALGRAAEDVAADHLQRAGLRLLLRNYRCRLGEIDLVLREGDEVLVLVEVRLRSRADYGGAAASVDGAKQRRLVKAARHLLMTRPALARLRVRFDVVELRSADAGGRELQWMRGAFDAG